MILKIFHADQWVIYDKIAQVIYKNEELNTDQIVSSKDILYDAVWGGEHPIEKGDTKVKMQVRFEDGKERLMLAIQSVYLCNDEGKTIEKIN